MLRSKQWFQNPDDPGMTALYLERFLNWGMTSEELQSDRPIIGIAQTGSDLSPCNRIHTTLEARMRDGIRDAGGIPISFPVHPIQETGRRPTAALDRNLAFLGMVEVIHGYPLDGIIFTTGCDKTTPAAMMAAVVTDIPSLLVSGGAMLDGHFRGELSGSGATVWSARLLLAEGKITAKEFFEIVASSAPSPGHCNTMGTASSMAAMAEALGLMLPGGAAIPAPHRARAAHAYAAGKRVVELVAADLRPSSILSRTSFENAIAVNSAIGGSTNCVIHLTAVARHAGIPLVVDDWQRFGHHIPLLVDCQPAGRYLMESFFRAGGVPAVMAELLNHGKLDATAKSVARAADGGLSSMDEVLAEEGIADADVIRPYTDPLMAEAGFVVLRGNLFDSAIVKTSVISADFRQRFLSHPGREDVLEGEAIVFESAEDYHARLNSPDLPVTETSILVMRGAGPLSWPGSAEVVNMQPPDRLIKAGVRELPCIGDGRQSGTSGSPSILHASPESALRGGMAVVQTGDRLRLDFRHGTADICISAGEYEARLAAWQPPELVHDTPWQELYRAHVSGLDGGGVFESALAYKNVSHKVPRNNH